MILAPLEPLLFVIDVSDSMSASEITALNHTMRKTLALLKEKSKNNHNFDLKVGVLTVGNGCQWLNSSGLESLEDFVWEDLHTGGQTGMGAALRELNDKLSVRAYLQIDVHHYMLYLPVIVFVSCCGSTDDYEVELQKLQWNSWFQRAIKIGFAIGDESDAGCAMLCNVVGSSDAVFRGVDLNRSDCSETFTSAVVWLSRITDEKFDGDWYADWYTDWPYAIRDSCIIPPKRMRLEPIILPDERQVRKVLPMIFVLDVSDSMSGSKIAVLNRTMRETLALVKKATAYRYNPNFEPKVGILTVGTGCRWLNPSGLESLEEFIWRDLETGGRLTWVRPCGS